MTDIKLSMARFRRLWADKTITRKEVAAQFGVNKSTATALAQRDGLPQRWFKASDDEVRAAWLDPSISVPEACARLGMSRSGLWRRISKLGLPPRSRQRRDAGVADWPLFDDMVRYGVMLRDIGDLFGRTPQTVGRIARRRGLFPRAEAAPNGLTLAEYAEIKLAAAMAARVRAERSPLADHPKAAGNGDTASQGRIAA